MLTPSVSPVSHAPFVNGVFAFAIIIPAKIPAERTRRTVTPPSFKVGTIDDIMISETLVPIFL